MQYEWDEKKCESNLAIHGVDFAIAAAFEWSMSIDIEDVRHDYSEARTISFAPIAGRLYAMVWTQRGDVCRIISLRKANRREVQRYVSET